MAIFTFAQDQRVNTKDLSLGDIGNYDFFNGSSEQLLFSDDAANFTALNGTGFVFMTFLGQLVDVSGGTITGLLTAVQSQPLITVTGWSLDAAAVFDLVVAGDERAIRDLLLAGDDTLQLGNKKDNADGGAGNDILAGLRGDDVLAGGKGNDTVVGGRGNDVLTGDSGRDVFVFNERLDAATNVDTVTDFDTAKDSFLLHVDIFGGLGDAGGAMNATRFALNAPADANDRLIYNPESGALIYDADGNGAGVGVQFAQLAVDLDLTAAHFILV